MTHKAAISPAAQALLNACEPTPNIPLKDIDFPAQRRDSLTAYQPNIDAALAKYPVTLSEQIIAGTRCQIVTPPNANPDRQILFFFGGGFVQGSPAEDLPITAALAVKTGATLLVPHYPLAPEHPFPAALDTLTNIARFQFQSAPQTLIAGESAGGNLALAVTHHLRQEGLAPIALALLSPAADLSYAGDSAEADRDPFLPAHRIETVLGAYLQGQDPAHPDASPINGTFDTDFPPTLITTGTRDLLLSNCIRLTRVMRDAGAPIDLRVWEGLWHVFEFYADIPEADASLSEIADFLNTQFVQNA